MRTSHKAPLQDPALGECDHLRQLLEASSDRLRHRLLIEEAIAGASRLMIHSGCSDLDGVLKLLGEAAAVDRAYIFRYSVKEDVFDNTHEWCGPDVAPQVEHLQGMPASMFPWLVEQLHTGDNLVIPDVASLPPAAATERSVLEAQSIRSLLIVPISFSNGALAGLMGFDDIRDTRDWLPEDGRAVRVVGEMIATQWEQARTRAHHRKLVEQLNRVSSPYDAAGVILQAADELLGWDAAWIGLCAPDRSRFDSLLMFDEIDGARTELPPASSGLRIGGLTWRTLREGAIRIDRNPDEVLDRASAPSVYGDRARRSASILCVPICDGPLQLGVLSIQSYEFNAYSNADLQSLQTLAEHCAGALKRCQAETDRLRLTEDRLKAEIARRESEDALRFAMTAGRLGVWDRDLRTDVTNWTDYAQLLPNGEPTRAVRPVSEFLALLHPEDRELLEEATQRAIEEDSELAIEFRMSMPGLGERWCGSRGRVLRDSSGEPTRFIGIGEDVTNRKRLELAVREQQQFLDAVLENLTDGVIAMDREGALTYCNQVVRDRWGFDELPLPFSEWMKNLRVFHADGVTPMQVEEMPHSYALRGQPLRDVEVVVQRPTLEKSTLLVSAHPMSNANGERDGVVVTLHDITTRRGLEEQFRQSQKMEAIGRLAGGVAHDFNNLLAVISGYTELILLRQDLGSGIRTYLEEVQKAGDRAKNLTRQLLAFSRKQVVAPRPLDLGPAITNMEQMLRRLIGEDVELITKPADDLIVMMDPGQLEQVLLNLAVNARDAMPRGGKLTIETSGLLTAQPPADLRRNGESRSYARLSVTDTGHGMDRATQQRIFEPFFTTKPVGSGTGLGLSTVYGIVNQWGGELSVESAPGHGATFNVYLPLTTASADECPASVFSKLAAGTETILLVEDEEQVRRLTRQVLEMAGYHVIEASSPIEALQLAHTSAAHPHLLLTDIVMPQMSGRELAERLRSQRPQLPVIYMSGYTDDAVVRHGVLIAETEFIQKPFSPTELTRRIRAVLDQH